MLRIHLQNPVQSVDLLSDFIRYELALISVTLVILGRLCLSL